MANNRELSQFGSYVTVNDTDKTVGIATTVNITTGGLYVGGVQAIRPNGTWGGSSAGIQGAQGTQGVQGTQGTQGVQGTQGTTGAQGATGSQGTTGAQGATGSQGTTGTQGTLGTQGTAGPSTTINATDDTTTAILYPVMVGGTGSNQTAKASSTNNFVYNASSGNFGIGVAPSYRLDVNGGLNIRSASGFIRLTDQSGGGTSSDYWIGRGGVAGASLALYAPTSRAIEFGVANTCYASVETNALKLYNATQILNSSGRPILNQSGSILQVVQAVKTDGYGQNGNAWTDIPGMSLTITPSSSSSKVLIECRIGIVSLNGTFSSAFRLYRGATLIGGGDVVNSSESVFFRSSQMVNSDHGASDGMTYLDSPATTSATTYKIQMKVQSGAGCYINRDYTGNNTADVYGSRTISTLTAWEVSV
jgi:hypothetical protein